MTGPGGAISAEAGSELLHREEHAAEGRAEGGGNPGGSAATSAGRSSGVKGVDKEGEDDFKFKRKYPMHMFFLSF